MTAQTLGAHLGVFWRGLLIVTLTASNVAQIAGGHWLGAFVNGAAISWVWFSNARVAANSHARYGRECYALGAGIGTIFGMWIIQRVYG